MRILLAIVSVVATLAAPHSAGGAEADKTARVGQIFLLKFPGNRDGGYHWRLNEAKSTGLHLVTVKDVGWTIHGNQGSILFRKPSVMRISVLPKAPGQARLVFDYVRKWGSGSPLKTELVRLVISPESVAAR